MLRIFLMALFSVWLASSGAQANQSRCFGPGPDWCAWTAPESDPSRGWGVSNKARLPGAVLETIVDARNNRAALRLQLSPIAEGERVLVTVSMRGSEIDYGAWQTFTVEPDITEKGTAKFRLDRRALEALLETPPEGFLYVFVELTSKNGNHKVSHKVPLLVLADALEFARLGK